MPLQQKLTVLVMSCRSSALLNANNLEQDSNTVISTNAEATLQVVANIMLGAEAGNQILSDMSETILIGNNGSTISVLPPKV